MYRVVVADDEPAIRAGIPRLIDWEEHGLEIAAVASNGREALDALERTGARILITDIRMPEMDGLRLVEEVRRRGLPVKAVILSGYNEFAYAREAVRLGIENYILKPVDEEELSATLILAAERLDAESTQDRRMAEGMESLREAILYRWVTGAISEEELRRREEALGVPLDRGRCAAFVVRGADARAGGEPGEASSGLRNACRSAYSTRGNAAVFASPGGDTIVITAWNEGESCIDAERVAMQECLRAIGTADGSPAAVSACGGEEDCPGGLPRSYRRACGILRRVERRSVRGLVEDASLPVDADPQPAREAESPLIRRVMQMLRTGYGQELSLKTVASELDVNPAYLGQLFKRETGEMFTSVLNGIRVARARELLETTALKAAQIGAQVGYANANYFYSVFKKLTGLYPAEYRARAVSGGEETASEAPL